MKKFGIEQLLTVDDKGDIQPPSIRQIQDKDVLELYRRDTSAGKAKYKAEVGVIYYLGDINSPAKLQGLSDKEALAEAIENYNLPKNYTPDPLVARLITKYYHRNITKAGVVIEGIYKNLHVAALAVTKITDIINEKLKTLSETDDIAELLILMGRVNDISKDLPGQLSAMKAAKDNLIEEQEEEFARGGGLVSSSMKADE